MGIRKLAESGIDAFRSYLHDLRAGSTAAPPFGLLTDPQKSKPIADRGTIMPRTFMTRLDAAGYLDDALGGIGEENIATDVGLWSWLSLFYFDQVCPPAKSGERKPGKDYRHILEPGYPYGHRHLLGGAYLVYTLYGLGKDTSALLLSTPPYIESKYNHEFAGRQSFITNRGIMEAAYKLYYDARTQRGKRGAQVRKRAPGTLYRFIDVIQQLDLNYDLYSMSGAEIIGLLPAEFDKWKI